MPLGELRILPPFAIGRLGAASGDPLDNFTVEDDPEHPLAWRKIVPQETLIVDEETGAVRRKDPPPESISFKSEKGDIRPVAPFLEVFAQIEGEQNLRPLHKALEQLGERDAKIEWRVSVANRKVVRRTLNEANLVHAEVDWFSDHDPHPLHGHCPNFVSPKSFIDFGTVRFIAPSDDYPEIRLRFVPAKGKIYGPKLEKQEEQDNSTKLKDPTLPPPFDLPQKYCVYDATKDWYGFGSDANPVKNETVPPALYAIEPPAPPWLHDNIAISRGYLDDTCDGFAEVKVTLSGGRELTAKARICAGPPALVPDAQFVRTLLDDLEQVILGPEVSEDEPYESIRDRACDIVRRAYETVRFMNVAVMNGNDIKGRPALLLDSMPEEEAADTERALRPIMGPGSVDTLAILGLHEQVYAALRGGAAPWFVDLLRKPDEVADYTDSGRRKMPALMCAADNNYLALTWRQIDTIRKASEKTLFHARADAAPQGVVSAQPGEPAKPWVEPVNRTAHLQYAAAGNPISSRPITSVANCCPGLEVDFRAVWRRTFRGIVLREYDNLVMEADPGAPDAFAQLVGHRLLRIVLPGGRSIPTMTTIWGPATSDVGGKIVLTTDENPWGLAQLEWSNLLAPVLAGCQGGTVRCDFTIEPADDQQPIIEDGPDTKKNYVSVEMQVRHFFEEGTAVIAEALAKAGELTQGLCSPWQNDYRECSCYYWASARPDFINVEPGPDGLSKGDNWLQKKRTGDYVPDDYVDSRLILYNELFTDWQKWLRFQIGGRDAPGELSAEPGDDEAGGESGGVC